MARKKEYNEEEVVEKAMELFWRNGYENTSMQMLEKEMGINKFSIYSSFGSKNGLFLESLKCYKQRLSTLMSKLENSSNGLLSIKLYFYDFLEFSKDNELSKGCLVTNAANELGETPDIEIQEALVQFTNGVKQLFTTILKQDSEKNEFVVEAQANYLLIAMYGLSSASRVFTAIQLENYIEHTFKNL